MIGEETRYTSTQLETGQYYVGYYEGDPNNVILMKCLKHYQSEFGIGLQRKTHYSRGSFSCAEYWVKATSDQIRHLDACIKAGKYVEAPIPEIVDNYEIY